jgi:hypothetical protein
MKAAMVLRRELEIMGIAIYGHMKNTLEQPS